MKTRYWLYMFAGVVGLIAGSLFEARKAYALFEFTGPIENLDTSEWTTDRIVYNDSDNRLQTISDLTSWIAGTAGEVNIVDDGDGTVTIDIIAGSNPATAQYLVLALDATLTNERVFTIGTALDGTDGGANSTYTIAFDSTEVGTTTWGSGSAIVWTFDASAGTDATLTLGNGTFNVSAGTLQEAGIDVKVVGTDPDCTQEGELGADTDDHTLRGYSTDDTTQYIYGEMDKRIQFTIVQPDDLDETDFIPVWYNDSSHSFIITSITAWCDDQAGDDGDFTLEETSSTNFTSQTTIEAITMSSDGTAVDYAAIAAVDIDHATIEAGNMIGFDPSTDDLEWVKVCIEGYFDAD